MCLCIPKRYGDQVSRSLVRFPKHHFTALNTQVAYLKWSTPEFRVTASSLFSCRTSQAPPQYWADLSSLQILDRLLGISSCFRRHIHRFRHVYCNNGQVMLHYRRQKHCLTHQNLVRNTKDRTIFKLCNEYQTQRWSSCRHLFVGSVCPTGKKEQLCKHYMPMAIPC